MKSTHCIAGIFTIVACLAGVTAFAAEEQSSSATQQAPCCFESPRFSGTCQVTPGPDEGCGDILGYLNNPNSVGKNYCGNTKVRGGWTQVSCEGATAVSADSCRNTEHEE